MCSSSSTLPCSATDPCISILYKTVVTCAVNTRPFFPARLLLMLADWSIVTPIKNAFLFAWICHVVCQDSILAPNHNWTINCTERSKAHPLGQGGVIHQLFRHVWGGELTLDTSTNPSRPRFHMHFRGAKLKAAYLKFQYSICHPFAWTKAMQPRGTFQTRV